MERTNLQIVAGGIVDDAAKEYLETNLASWESVDAYASNACGIELTRTDCEKILRACRAYLEGASGNAIEHFI